MIDEAALMQEHEGLVRKAALSLRSAGASVGLDYEDLLQAGRMGLLHAMRNWEPARGHRFSTYACPCVRGGILNEIARMAAVNGRQEKRGTPRPHFVSAIHRITVEHTDFDRVDAADALSSMPLRGRERDVVAAMRGGDCQAQVARLLGISKQRIHQILVAMRARVAARAAG